MSARRAGKLPLPEPIDADRGGDGAREGGRVTAETSGGLNGSTDALAKAFRDVVAEAVRPIESRLDRVEKDVSTLKTDTKQILEIVTGGRP